MICSGSDSLHIAAANSVLTVSYPFTVGQGFLKCLTLQHDNGNSPTTDSHQVRGGEHVFIKTPVEHNSVYFKMHWHYCKCYSFHCHCPCQVIMYLILHLLFGIPT